MFLDYYCCIVLNFSLLLRLLAPDKLRQGRVVKRIGNEKVFFLLYSWTQQRYLFLKFVINLWVKNWFLNDLAYFVLDPYLLFCRFSLVALRLCVNWGWRWMLEFAFCIQSLFWCRVPLKGFRICSLFLLFFLLLHLFSSLSPLFIHFLSIYFSLRICLCQSMFSHKDPWLLLPFFIYYLLAYSFGFYFFWRFRSVLYFLYRFFMIQTVEILICSLRL